MGIFLPAPHQPPIYVGGVVRVGPGIGEVATACYWKFWTEGNEVYAAGRGGGHLTKISVHASGEIHMHVGPRNVQKLSPPVPLGDDWVLAVEFRFLLGHGAFSPPPQLVKLKKKTDKALLAQVPPDHVLVLNLLIGKSSAAPPGAFANVGQIWRSTLKDGRVAVLVGRSMPIDEENAKKLKLIRFEMNPKVNFEGSLKGQPPPYFEFSEWTWGPGGNVIFVVPMGAEGFRFEGDDAEPESLESRQLLITCPDVTVPISAPNGATVGTLSIGGGPREIDLVKNTSVIGVLGTVTLSIDAEKLRFGETFTRPSVGIECPPTIGGAQPREWAYPVHTRFDGENLTVAIEIISCAFRNSNTAVPMHALNDGEELLVRAPAVAIELRVSRAKSVDSLPLNGSFRLRDIE
jgi:hypothetical protein